jgi:D-alanine transaminase
MQHDLFKHNQMQDGFCYLQITRGTTNRQPNCPKGLNPTISATVSEKKIISKEQFDKGFSVMTTKDIRWQRCDIKTVGLLASTLTNQNAKDLGFDDAIFVRDSIVTEATYANVFIVDKNDQLITHPASNHILCGITRNRLITIAKFNKISVIEREFGVEELYEAMEVFLTSSTLLIRPIIKIDDKTIGKNSAESFVISRFLLNKYREFIAGN